MKTSHYIEIKWVKYPYTISPWEEEGVSLVECPSAAVSQGFLNEDIPALLWDLKHLILAEIKYHRNLSTVIRFRASVWEREKIQKNAKKHGYKNMTEFIKDRCLTS